MNKSIRNNQQQNTTKKSIKINAYNLHSLLSTVCSVSKAGKLLVWFTHQSLFSGRPEWHGMDMGQVVDFW